MFPFAADEPTDFQSELLPLQCCCLRSAIDFAFDKGQVNLFVGLTLTAYDFLWACRLVFNQCLLTLLCLMHATPHFLPCQKHFTSMFLLHMSSQKQWCQSRTFEVQKCVIKAALYRQDAIMPLVKDLLCLGSFV